MQTVLNIINVHCHEFVNAAKFSLLSSVGVSPSLDFDEHHSGAAVVQLQPEMLVIFS